LANATYSPLSYTPGTETTLRNAGTAISKYYNLIKKGLLFVSYENQRYSPRLHSQKFEVLLGVYPILSIDGVDSALKLKNIYCLLKACQDDISGFIMYLRDNGIPTLVQSVDDGSTPPFNQTDFSMDGLEHH
jgi:hypothetical protein